MVKVHESNQIFFKRISSHIKVNDPYNGSWWESNDDRSKAYEYNQKWEEWIGENTNATTEQVLDFGKKLSQEYGFKVNTYNTYANEYVYVGTGGNFDQVSNTTETTFDVYLPEVLSFSDYYPFHMQMPGRFDNSAGYRYGGSNGQEKETEITGNSSHYSAEYWMYDARLGRRWNVDPVVKYYESPFTTFANNPMQYIDKNGDDIDISELYDSYMDEDGNKKYKNEQEIKSFELWASTKQGRKYILDNAQEGFELKGVYVAELNIKANKAGNNKDVNVKIGMGYGAFGNAYTTAELKDGKLNIGLYFYPGAHYNTGPSALLQGVDDISHEALYHSNEFITHFKSGNLTEDKLKELKKVEVYHERGPSGGGYLDLELSVLKETKTNLYNRKWNDHLFYYSYNLNKTKYGTTLETTVEYAQRIQDDLSKVPTDEQLINIIKGGSFRYFGTDKK